VAAAVGPLARDGRVCRVLVLRGVPGAGKSTVARAVAAHVRLSGHRAVVVSADKTFVGADGVYRFDPARLPEAHGACLKAFVALVDRYPGGVVVVDNTATTNEEVAPYVAVGSAYGWDVSVVTVSADPFDAARRNVHGVPPAAVGAMHGRLVDAGLWTPPWWRKATVTEADVLALVAAEEADPAVFDV